MNLPTGARLGPYEIVGLLAKGGMGEVYRRLHSLGPCPAGTVERRRPDADSTARLGPALAPARAARVVSLGELRETWSRRERK